MLTGPWGAPRDSRAQRPARRGRVLLAVSLLTAAFALFAWGGAAAAAPLGEESEFSAGPHNNRILQLIAPGPHRHLWFTDQGHTRAVGRVTPTGDIHERSP